MAKRLTQKQEMFCLSYFVLRNATQAAIEAGYKPKAAHSMATENLQKPAIKARLDELSTKIEKGAVMSVQERMERLTEIARARLTEFMELGQDGSWVNLGEETLQGGAIQEIHSRTQYDNNGANSTIYTSVKLHDPMKAIDLLNKMDKLYSETPFIQDNRVARQINIFVIDNETKDLISQVAERTKLIANGSKNHQSIQGDSEGMGRG